MYKDADSTALFSDVWVKIRVRPYELLKDGVDGSNYALTDESFLDFLHLLKLLPSARCKFETSVNNFIKISEVL